MCALNFDFLGTIDSNLLWRALIFEYFDHFKNSQRQSQLQLRRHFKKYPVFIFRKLGYLSKLHKYLLHKNYLKAVLMNKEIMEIRNGFLKAEFPKKDVRNPDTRFLNPCRL